MRNTQLSDETTRLSSSQITICKDRMTGRFRPERSRERCPTPKQVRGSRNNSRNNEHSKDQEKKKQKPRNNTLRQEEKVHSGNKNKILKKTNNWKIRMDSWKLRIRDLKFGKRIEKCNDKVESLPESRKDKDTNKRREKTGKLEA